jgi:hypothetical protein
MAREVKVEHDDGGLDVGIRIVAPLREARERVDEIVAAHDLWESRCKPPTATLECTIAKVRCVLHVIWSIMNQPATIPMQRLQRL